MPLFQVMAKKDMGAGKQMICRGMSVEVVYAQQNLLGAQPSLVVDAFYQKYGVDIKGYYPTHFDIKKL